MCRKDKKRQSEEKETAALSLGGRQFRGCVQYQGADQLLDFPFPRAVSSPPLLIQVSEIDEESQEHEDQVELQSVGEA